MSSIYNSYIPGGGPYEKIPEDDPPGFERIFSSLLGGEESGGKLSGLLKKFKLDSGDVLLLLILFLLLKEGDHSDLFLLLALGAVFFLDND